MTGAAAAGGADAHASAPLALVDIHKRFGRTRAVGGVTVTFGAGETHVVLGQNGSGKSTLLKVAGGELRPDAGAVLLHGRAATLRDPRAAARAGIALIPQELPLCEALSVAENVLLGRQPTRAGAIDRRRARELARGVLEALGSDLDPLRRVHTLAADERQLVAISRALATGARVLLLDEPTSSLSLAQSASLFALLARLRDQGVALVYVTQRLAEVQRIADRVTVLRDGRVAATLTPGEADVQTLSGHLAPAAQGTTIRPAPLRTSGESRSPLLATRGLRARGVDDASLVVGQGEIVGLAGLVGSGSSALLEALAGLRTPSGGCVELAGRRLELGSPFAAVRSGIGFVPADRRAQGLIPGLSVAENLALGHVARLRPFLVRPRRRDAHARELIARFGIQTGRVATPVRNLSGGNQQKVVLARALAGDPRLLLLDEPARGVDAAAKADIFALVRTAASRGTGVLVASHELEDLLALCDRILVVRDGTIAAERHARAVDERGLIALIGEDDA